LPELHASGKKLEDLDDSSPLTFRVTGLESAVMLKRLNQL